MRANRATRIVCVAAAALAAITLTVPSASAAPITVYGGPTYTPGVGGFQGGSVAGVNDAGTVVGNAGKYDGAGAELGSRAVRWDGSGAPAMELGNLGTNASGVTISRHRHQQRRHWPSARPTGTTAGVSKGTRAVRWDASGTAATELRNLGTDASGVTQSQAFAINDAGRIAGSAAKHISAGACAVFECRRPLECPERGGDRARGSERIGRVCGLGMSPRPSTTPARPSATPFPMIPSPTTPSAGAAPAPYATVLGNLGSKNSGFTLSGYYDSAVAINDAGTAVGRS